MLAAIPSVIVGFWGVIVLAPFVHQHIEPWLNHALGFIPIFGSPQSTGLSVFTAGLILSLMVLPIIASLSRDLFLTVPRELRDGAEALGATRWEMIRGVVLPTTASGVAAATILGLGRALGEAIAVAQVIGAGNVIHASLFDDGCEHRQPSRARVRGRADASAHGVVVLSGGDPAGDQRVDQPGRAGDRPSVRRVQGAGPMSDLFDPTAPLTASGNLRRRQAVSRLVTLRRDGLCVRGGAVLVISMIGVITRGASALSITFLTKDPPRFRRAWRRDRFGDRRERRSSSAWRRRSRCRSVFCARCI